MYECVVCVYVCVYHKPRNTIYSCCRVNKHNLFTLQMFTRHPLYAVPSARRPCNEIQALISRSSRVVEEMSTQTIPIGLAQYFTRNTPRVPYKLSRRAIILEGEFRKSFLEERTSGLFWKMSRTRGEEGTEAKVMLSWVTWLERSLEGPDLAEPWILTSIMCQDWAYRQSRVLLTLQFRRPMHDSMPVTKREQQLAALYIII